MSARLKTFLLWLTAFGGGLLANGACAADAGSSFESANRLYEERKFAEAAAVYEKILDTGQVSPALYFNLGNTFFKSGKNGRAILAYRQAAQLAPRDPDVRANLQFVRNQVEGPTLRNTRWQRALGTLSLDEWAALNGAGLWLTFGLLAAAQLRPAWKSALRNVTPIAGGATLLLAACLFSALSNNGSARIIVVTATEVTVRNGPLEESQSAFSAHDGAELQVLDHKDDWLQVSDGTRRIGWLKRGEVALVNPS
jgi:tetratricopeptide (TPR) repeat protein